LQRSEMALLDKLNFVLGKQFQTCFLYGSNWYFKRCTPNKKKIQLYH
jgi:hypothetical protein